MQYTDNEAALIGGLISNYFFQPSVDATLCESCSWSVRKQKQIKRQTTPRFQ